VNLEQSNLKKLLNKIKINLTMAINIARYNTIFKKTDLFKINKITTFIPTPLESDYINGYVKRYFTQKSNDAGAPIYEISKDLFSIYAASPFFIAVSILWRLSGSSDEISDSNLKSIKLGCKTIRNLYIYLPNTLQFSKQ
jgi:hypothetical protein